MDDWVSTGVSVYSMTVCGSDFGCSVICLGFHVAECTIGRLQVSLQVAGFRCSPVILTPQMVCQQGFVTFTWHEEMICLVRPPYCASVPATVIGEELSMFFCGMVKPGGELRRRHPPAWFLFVEWSSQAVKLDADTPQRGSFLWNGQARR